MARGASSAPQLGYGGLLGTHGPGVREVAEQRSCHSWSESRLRVLSTPEGKRHFAGAVTAGTDLLVDTQHLRDLAPLAVPSGKRQATGRAATDDDDTARLGEKSNQQGAGTATPARPAPRIAVEPRAQQACHAEQLTQSACPRAGVMRGGRLSGIPDSSPPAEWLGDRRLREPGGLGRASEFGDMTTSPPSARAGSTPRSRRYQIAC